MQLTIEAIEKHLSAIPSALYEVGVYFPATDAGTDSKMLLRTWDESTVLKSIPWLRAKNAEGAAIYVRPRGEHRYSLVDDLTAEAVQRMKVEGFAPAIVVETSPCNFQAWLNHGEVLDKQTSTSAARALAERFGGDPGAADWRHFGRLGGFTNRKPSYLQPNGLFPFVKVAQHTPGIYREAENILRALRTVNRDHRAIQRLVCAVPVIGQFRSIDDFRHDPKYSADGNRIDLAFALHALGRGLSETSVRAAIQTRDLSKKGTESRQAEYVNRTISRALHRLGLDRVR